MMTGPPAHTASQTMTSPPGSGPGRQGVLFVRGCDRHGEPHDAEDPTYQVPGQPGARRAKKSPLPLKTFELSFSVAPTP